MMREAEQKISLFSVQKLSQELKNCQNYLQDYAKFNLFSTLALTVSIKITIKVKFETQ